MKKFKGTKGNWDVKAFKHIHGELFIMHEDDPLARVAINNYSTKEEANANADLIASAPELLEALQRVRLYLIDNQDSLAPFPTRSELDNIREVIKKALGE